MLRTRRTPKDRAAFPTELPSGLRIPASVSPETYASHRDVLSVLLLRFMTSRLRAMYQRSDALLGPRGNCFPQHRTLLRRTPRLSACIVQRPETVPALQRPLDFGRYRHSS